MISSSSGSPTLAVALDTGRIVMVAIPVSGVLRLAASQPEALLSAVNKLSFNSVSAPFSALKAFFVLVDEQSCVSVNGILLDVNRHLYRCSVTKVAELLRIEEIAPLATAKNESSEICIDAVRVQGSGDLNLRLDIATLHQDAVVLWSSDIMSPACCLRATNVTVDSKILSVRCWKAANCIAIVCRMHMTNRIQTICAIAELRGHELNVLWHTDSYVELHPTDFASLPNADPIGTFELSAATSQSAVYCAGIQSSAVGNEIICVAENNEELDSLLNQIAEGFSNDISLNREVVDDHTISIPVLCGYLLKQSTCQDHFALNTAAAWVAENCDCSLFREFFNFFLSLPLSAASIQPSVVVSEVASVLQVCRCLNWGLCFLLTINLSHVLNLNRRRQILSRM